MYWNQKLHKNVPSIQVDMFLAEIEATCRKHNLSISHEDGHGSFIIEPLDEGHITWLKDAATTLPGDPPSAD